MQGYSSANYPYYGQQSMYSQQPYPSSGYQPYNAYQNYPQSTANTPFIPPLSSFDTAPPQPQPSRKRYYQATSNPTNAQPLKSALKKAAAATPLAAGHTQPLPQEDRHKRNRTTSNAKDKMPLERTKSHDVMEDFQSIHIFLVLVGNSEVHLEYLTRQAQDEIRSIIFKPYKGGIDLEQRKGSLWRVRLRGTPWDMNGLYAAEALQMIVGLFTLFAQRGYTFQTMTNIASLSPRLIFVTAPIDTTSQFFLAYFSNKGRRVTLVRPPSSVNSLGDYLRDLLQDQIAVDEVIVDNRVIEMKAPLGATGDDSAKFMLLVLKGLSSLGFQLETTLLMAPKLTLGRFGLGFRRELLVFRGMPAR